jgi:single-strand DNA-binding protein
MASDLNKLTLIGRLARDAEYRMNEGRQVAFFTLVNNHTYTSRDGQKRDEVNYFDCEVWGKMADVIKQYTSKGKQIAIEGRLRYSSWETPEGKRNKIKIVVESFQLLGGGAGGQSNRGGGGGGFKEESAYSAPEEDMGSYGSEDDPF